MTGDDGQGPSPAPQEWALIAAREALDGRVPDGGLIEHNVARGMERVVARALANWRLAATEIAARVADEDIPDRGLFGDEPSERRRLWASACGRIFERIHNMRDR